MFAVFTLFIQIYVLCYIYVDNKTMLSTAVVCYREALYCTFVNTICYNIDISYKWSCILCFSEWSYGFTNSYVPPKLSQHQTMNLDDGPLHVLNISLQNLTFSLDTSTEVIFVCKERNLPNTNRVFRVKCKSTRSKWFCNLKMNP